MAVRFRSLRSGLVKGTLICGAVLAVVVIAFAFDSSRSGARVTVTAGHADNATAPAEQAAAAVAPTVTTAPCSVGAVGTLPAANGTSVTFPPAQALPANAVAQSVTTVETTARQMAAKFGVTAVAPTTAPMAAELVPYSEFLTQAGWPANPDINLQRCMWVLTVHAPISSKPALGGTAKISDVYTVALDAGTGSLVGLLEGQALLSQ